MFRRVLVPLDGSPESEAVLVQLQRPAMSDAEFFLLHIVPVLPTPTGAPPPTILQMPEQAHAMLEKAAAQLPSKKYSALVRSGDPADRIARVALELNIDLIAMATHGRSGLGRLLLGSVAETVVRTTQLPVFLVRPGVPPPPRLMRRILVPVDGGDRSMSILKIVKPWSLERGAEIVLVHIQQEYLVAPASAGGMAGVVHALPPGDPPPAVVELPLQLQREGHRARLLLGRGDPVRSILELAGQEDADLIAMTTSGRQGLDRLFLGSVAEGVLRGSNLPVLLYRPS